MGHLIFRTPGLVGPGTGLRSDLLHGSSQLPQNGRLHPAGVLWKGGMGFRDSSEIRYRKRRGIVGDINSA